MSSKPVKQRSISSFFSPPTKSLATKSDKPKKDDKPYLCPPREDEEQITPPPAKRLRKGSALFEKTPLSNAKSEAFVCDDPKSFIGRRLKLCLSEDDVFYEGSVESYDEASGKHFVVYEDAEQQRKRFDVDLTHYISNEKLKWMDDSPPRRFRRLRRLSDSYSKTLSNSVVKSAIVPKTPSALASKKVVEDISSSTDDEESESDEDWEADGKQNVVSDDSEDEESGRQKRKRTRGTLLRATKHKTTEASKKAVHRSSYSVSKTPPDSTNMNESSKLDNTKSSFQAEKRKAELLHASSFSQSKTQGHFNQEQQQRNTCGDGDGFLVPLNGEAAERFGNRISDKLQILFKNRKDASGKRPGSPGYDPKTLYLPHEFLKGLTGGQRQWWEFKSRHMDKVLFFKMGKFYELFEMDAHVGVQELDLQYMKGEQPHCGFPEKNFSENVEKLASKGYRVLVVEQTETPEQLEQRRKESGSKDKVVKREICAVITKGTMTEQGMLDTTPDSPCMLSLTEEFHNSLDINQTSNVTIGVCIADSSTSKFILGQFSDDSSRSSLRSILSEIRPVEVIKPDSVLSKETEKVLRDGTRNPLVNNLLPGKEFWDAGTTLIESRKVFSSCTDKLEFGMEGSDGLGKVKENDGLPHIICQFANAGQNGHLALSAFGACLYYLRQALLDQSLLRFGKFEILPCSELGTHHSMAKETEKANQDDSSHHYFFSEPYMVLDAAALENLEIFENSHNCSTLGTVFAQLDHCVTGFGKRLLKKWIAKPLRHVNAILDRQDAIAQLKGPACDAAVKFQKQLVKLPDMERLLARLFSKSSGDAGRNASRVVLYEDVGRQQLHQFVVVLRGCQSLIQACEAFRANIPEVKSVLLEQKLNPGELLPNLKQIINKFESAFDWSEAEKAGRIIPHEGTNKEYDEAKKRVEDIERELEKYLESQRKFFGNKKEINYVTVGKDQYLLEIPESILSKVPQEYENRSSRKGFRRFWTPTVKQLCQVLGDLQTQKEMCLKGTLQELIRQFCQHHESWRMLVNVVAELDALISLAFASNYFGGPTCRPVIRSIGNSDNKNACSPYIHAKMLGHPILSAASGSKSFIPNNVDLGGESSSFLLISGPNMGGKSTIIRQVCLAVILAQLGCDVPAEEFELSPVDRVFVRMGAKDHIMTSQSTFLVEMLETSLMLSSATRDSLIALDELGRGTATSDGQAIAHAVLDYLAHKTRCRGMFSTHYHNLAVEYENDPAVRLCHMACNVGALSKGVEEVTFLYKLMHGACPKSYGINVARLAGMPAMILERAAKKSAEFESDFGPISIKCDKAFSTYKIHEIEQLVQETVNVLKQVNALEKTSIDNKRCLVDVWHKVCQQVIFLKAGAQKIH